jgi:hypothetical protein
MIFRTKMMMWMSLWDKGLHFLNPRKIGKARAKAAFFPAALPIFLQNGYAFFVMLFQVIMVVHVIHIHRRLFLEREVIPAAFLTIGSLSAETSIKGDQ